MENLDERYIFFSDQTETPQTTLEGFLIKAIELFNTQYQRLST
jgi:hypothetical protein